MRHNWSKQSFKYIQNNTHLIFILAKIDRNEYITHGISLINPEFIKQFKLNFNPEDGKLLRFTTAFHGERKTSLVLGPKMYKLNYYLYLFYL